MDYSLSTFWWVLAGVAVAVELATGTFYLLMMAVGLAAGATAAHLGSPLTLQIVAAAVIGGGFTAAWHWHRQKQPAAITSAENRDVNLDVGERVMVTAWGADRTARVSYRGSVWTARLEPQAPANMGEHLVKAVEGNWLILVPVSSF